jgi:tetratricopeptide (TPR) repeat protein
MLLHSKIYTLLLFVVFSSSCAYYNTFYNAEQYFEEAEKLRLEKDGEMIPISAMDKYGKTIEKSKKVIEDFPESKYVNEALLLMGKARYYRSDYDLAIDNLKVIMNDGSDKIKEEAKYWQALCKWKKGSVSASIDELNTLLNNSKSKRIKAKCYLSLAEIANESKGVDLSLDYLQKAAKLTTNRNERGVIYGKLSKMAFDKQEYTLAKDGYNNVIAFSLSKDKIEDAHLQILKILRIENNYRSAEKKIKSMLLDDKFNRISGELELELVQLYKAQGDFEDIESRLETIVNDYQRTTVSAEAYYQLGRIHTSDKWDLSKAKEYFDMVSKESSRSIYSPMAKNYSRAIDLYQIAVKDIEQHSKMDISENIGVSDSLIDSTKTSIPKEVRPDRTVPELYYQLADLEAFTFDRYEESILFLKRIINDFPESKFKSKSMFALVFVYEALDDSISSAEIKSNLLKNFPESEYASFLTGGSGISDAKGQRKILKEAESEMLHDKQKAINILKSSIQIDSEDEYALSAAFAIGYYYDQEAVIDSALKYYTWIKDNHPNSDQSIHATQRLNSISLALSSVEPDTIESISGE